MGSLDLFLVLELRAWPPRYRHASPAGCRHRAPAPRSGDDPPVSGLRPNGEPGASCPGARCPRHPSRVHPVQATCIRARLQNRPGVSSPSPSCVLRSACGSTRTRSGLRLNYAAAQRPRKSTKSQTVHAVPIFPRTMAAEFRAAREAGMCGPEYGRTAQIWDSVSITKERRPLSCSSRQWGHCGDASAHRSRDHVQTIAGSGGRRPSVPISSKGAP